MSNRVRIVVQRRGEATLFGTQARKFVFANSAPPFLPVEWAALPTWRKVVWLAKYLPKPARLFVFREPRSTPARKSRYWNKVIALGGTVPERPAPRFRRPEPPWNVFVDPAQIRIPDLPGGPFPGVGAMRPVHHRQHVANPE